MQVQPISAGSTTRITCEASPPSRKAGVVSQFESTPPSRPYFREGRLWRESRLLKTFWVPAFARTIETFLPEIRAQAWRRVQIHVPAEQRRQLPLYGEERQSRRMAWLKLHQHVHVACRRKVIAQHRSEEGQLLSIPFLERQRPLCRVCRKRELVDERPRLSAAIGKKFHRPPMCALLVELLRFISGRDPGCRRANPARHRSRKVHRARLRRGPPGRDDRP